MQCERVQLELQAYLMDELAPQEQAAVTDHLSSCSSCAQEAAAMKEVGQELRSGLNEWVNQGVCPPDLLSRIEQGFQLNQRRVRRQSWPMMLGAVAAVAAILVLLYSQSPDLTHQIAALPFVGGLAARFLPGDSGPAVTGEYRLVQQTAFHRTEGVSLFVTRLETNATETRVHYSLEGASLDTGADFMAYPPTLQAGANQVAFQRLEVEPQAGGVTVDAYFAPVQVGVPLTLMINALPVRSGSGGTVIRQNGPWQVSLQN